MKYLILAAALLAFPAFAQDVIINDPSVTAGEVNANSAAGAQNNVTGLDAQVNFEAAPYQNHSRVETVPNVTPPSIVGGNPCSIGGSLGGSILGFGIAGGVQTEGDKCETRQAVALLANMGYKAEALMMFCMNSEKVSNTYKAMGMNCTDLAGQLPTGTQFPATMSRAEPTPGEEAVEDAVQSGIVATMNRDTVQSCSDYNSAMNGSWDEASAGCKAMHVARIGAAGIDR